MPDYKQAGRPLQITTPLGPDILLITGLKGHEEISHLFDFRVSLVADVKKEVKFDKIIGQSVTVEMRLINGDKRYFNGIVKRFSQGRRDENFLHFKAEIVPKFWFLTKKVRSRTFQHLAIPDIIKQVLVGLDVNYDLTGIYKPRDYCVQYRESDFDFVSRLMEEEGIYYFFKHSDGNHQLMVSDNISKHPPVDGQTTAIYEEATGDVRTDMRVTHWEKTQDLRSGEYTLWDHCFELPGNHLEAKEKTIASVAVGKVTHKLNLANDQLEIYDYPGCYAQRFDGVDPNGGDRPADIQNIFDDRMRTVRLRMEQEEVCALLIEGTGDCGQFVPGHKFTLERHFDADGSYLLTRVEHEATDSSYLSDEIASAPFTYENHFRCIPEVLRFRPQRVTPRPKIDGMQTATVVGPKGEEIFVDKYGRVKVQFHWDREGKRDANSSCWLRVGQIWAGKSWGAFFWPRIGHEVIVIFEEGDPDQPMIIGSVYNHDNMPWYALPQNKQLAGIKSASVHGTAHKNFNGIVFNDAKGKEHLSIHSENSLSLNSEVDKVIHSGRNKGERVGVANLLTVGKFIPLGGGSGGGWDGGNTMNSPAPLGVMGMNAMVTYGDAFQCADPLSHQLVLGQNLQMTVSLGALLGEMKGLYPNSATYIDPGLAQAIGGAMGAMQFTIGANAQFTLGQSFEISVGPPKIEIHKQHNVKWDVTRILCIILGLLSEAFGIAYDLLKGANNAHSQSSGAAATPDESSGDNERAIFILAYQAITDPMLVAILLVERYTDQPDWYGSDLAKQAYKLSIGSFGLWHTTAINPSGVGDDGPTVADGDVSSSLWSGVGKVGLAVLGVVALVLVELTSIPHVGDSAESQ